MIKYVYSLKHEYLISNKEEKPVYSCKLIGYFESYASARKAIKDYVRLPGFCNYPNGFKIKKIEVDKIEYHSNRKKCD